MPSLVSAHGGSQTATLYFDLPITAITTADVSFAPDPGVTSVSLASNKESALIFFTTPATPGASYTVTVAASVSTPSLTNTVLTFPLVFCSSPTSDVKAENGNLVPPTFVPTVYPGYGYEADAKNGTVTEKPQIVYYLMRAYNTATSTYVWWTVANTPDFVGTRSGYSAANLTDIVLDQTICP